MNNGLRQSEQISSIQPCCASVKSHSTGITAKRLCSMRDIEEIRARRHQTDEVSRLTKKSKNTAEVGKCVKSAIREKHSDQL